MRMVSDRANAIGPLAENLLAHPIYLDVPMLVSFLAALEGGVSFEDQSTRRSGRSARRAREARGAAGARIPALPSIFSLDVSGHLRSEASQDDAEEVFAIRRHTEASLFNVLRSRLVDAGAITAVQAEAQLPSISFGDLVEFSGEVVGNPLQQLLALLLQFANLAGVDLETILTPPQTTTKQRGASQRTKPTPTPVVAEDEAAGIRQFVAVVGEMLNAKVRDYVMLGDDEFRAVLTLASDFISDQAHEYLQGSHLRVLEKVTGVVGSGEELINLTRCSSLGVLGSDSLRELFETISEGLEAPINATIADPLVVRPSFS